MKPFFLRSATMVFALCALIFTGCVTAKKVPQADLNRERVKRAKAEKRVAHLQREVTGLKTENGVLAKALERQKVEDPSEPPEYRADMVSQDTGKQNETMLYQKIVDAYKAKDDAGVESLEAILRRAYSNSPYLDDVLYLKGMLAYHQGRYTEALEIMDQVIQTYPDSNKRRDVQLAKALVYKKLNLPDQARTVLQALKTDRLVKKRAVSNATSENVTNNTADSASDNGSDSVFGNASSSDSARAKTLPLKKSDQ